MDIAQGCGRKKFNIADEVKKRLLRYYHGYSQRFFDEEL